MRVIQNVSGLHVALGADFILQLKIFIAYVIKGGDPNLSTHGFPSNFGRY